MILALPKGENADGLSTVLTQQIDGMPELVRKSLTWDQGTGRGRHAALALATGLDVCFADTGRSVGPHGPRNCSTERSRRRAPRMNDSVKYRTRSP
ncbi:hypothetical protein ACFYY3_25035 [Streptomyces sp. NPDC001812]|uniref:hypothetical protein n=1 Tax=unclassified Streptomyces TaxID=2593676 RepID=UPI00364C2594